jgi:hypothetical protein
MKFKKLVENHKIKRKNEKRKVRIKKAPVWENESDVAHEATNHIISTMPFKDDLIVREEMKKMSKKYNLRMSDIYRIVNSPFYLARDMMRTSDPRDIHSFCSINIMNFFTIHPRYVRNYKTFNLMLNIYGKLLLERRQRFLDTNKTRAVKHLPIQRNMEKRQNIGQNKSEEDIDLHILLV